MLMSTKLVPENEEVLNLQENLKVVKMIQLKPQTLMLMSTKQVPENEEALNLQKNLKAEKMIQLKPQTLMLMSTKQVLGNEEALNLQETPAVKMIQLKLPKMLTPTGPLWK